jgi:hypothetical protein
MALIAEVLVEEWLNRQGYFTIRGLKIGNDELDLLAIRPTNNNIEAIHIEVTASIRPISYISDLTEELSIKHKKKASSAWKRPRSILKECVVNWVEKKFFSDKKKELKVNLCPGAKWENMLIYGVVKHYEELEQIKETNIKIKPLKEIIQDLKANTYRRYATSTATDLINLLSIAT